MPPRCRRGRLAAAFPRPHVSGRLAPASAWAVWPRSLPPACSLPRVRYLSIAILSCLHTILGALTLRRRPAVTPSSAHTSLEQRSLSPGVTAPLSWLLPIRLPPLARHRARHLYLHRRMLVADAQWDPGMRACRLTALFKEEPLPAPAVTPIRPVTTGEASRRHTGSSMVAVAKAKIESLFLSFNQFSGGVRRLCRTLHVRRRVHPGPA